MLIVDYRALTLSVQVYCLYPAPTDFQLRSAGRSLGWSLLGGVYITGVPVQASLQAANQQAGGAYRWRHLTTTIFVFLINMWTLTAYISSFYFYFTLNPTYLNFYHCVVVAIRLWILLLFLSLRNRFHPFEIVRRSFEMGKWSEMEAKYFPLATRIGGCFSLAIVSLLSETV